MNYDLDLDLDNICRVCLTQNDKLVNLFTTQIVDGYIRTMPAIVQYCLDIDISENDILPKLICEACKTTIINYFTFKERCKRTEKVLLESLQKVKEVSNDDDRDDKNDAMQNEKDEITEVTDFVIFTNEYEKPTEQDLEPDIDFALDKTVGDPVLAEEIEGISLMGEEPMVLAEEPIDEENDSQKTVEYIVNMADDTARKKLFEYPNTPESDLPEEETLIDEGLVDILDEDSVEEYLCEFCQQEFSKDMWIEHSRIEHKMCEECFVVFESKEELTDHQKLSHANSGQVSPIKTKRHTGNSWLCKICNKRWGSSEQLNQHKKLHDALNASLMDKVDCFECRHCHTVYLKADDLADHMHLHDGIRNSTDDAICTDYQFLEDEKLPISFICGICKTTYASLQEMRHHIIIHLSSFSCPFNMCGCEYDSFSRLSLHITKKHVYAEEHFCTHCRKERFATFDDLQNHIRFNCSAKTFSCYHCDKRFFSNKALQLHLKHAGSKKHECEHCGKTFAQHGELIIHMRIHTGERPFKCTICAKTYRTASMRAAHMDAHINGKTFQCTVCSKMLQSRTSYRNHMKRHTVGKSYKCNNCSKSFYTKYHLDVHTSKVHNKNRES